MKALAIIMLLTLTPAAARAQARADGKAAAVPPATDPRLYDIAAAPRADRIERDIRKLVSFGTRHTMSDTVSETRGIGAARRWIKAEFDRISAACGGCLEVTYQRSLVKGDPESRIRTDTWVVNVLAIQRGTTHPDRYVVMTGDIDSRVSDVLDATSDNPGANDNASGVAGVLEAARVLSRYRFGKTIVYAALSGEEQGLYGGAHMAEVAKAEGWVIEAVLNNDMIGNIEGVDGVVNNVEFRIFSEPTPVTETERERGRRRFTGGEVDGPSRQLARYIARLAERYATKLEPMMVYRLDRFGRGGHHRPFNDAGFPAVRIMEAHENYRRQHQDVRVERVKVKAADGDEREVEVAYGDVIEGVNFDYAAKLAGVNAITLASLAWAPPPPDSVRIRGAVRPAATLSWKKVDSPAVAGYKVYWRLTTEPQWRHSRWVGDVDEYTMEGLIIDNYLFGVAAVGKDGNESVVVFPR